LRLVCISLYSITLTSRVFQHKLTLHTDAFSHKLGYSTELASSLIKLQIQNLSSMDADWMYSAYHYSHPILTERLKAVGWTSETKVGGGDDAKKADEKKAEANVPEKEL